ncbi:putative xanthine dehydrogenase subunit A [Frondihabitans sp. 762G35]|uniref:XdhC family protein n=1 Tax=Frondihabitans sp. 762G35 TaxID=1446794 RepID=UPI000D219020|nr:XdhC/CoxI family protein [Frondihabitans sp. 762G35]ARC58489.1 putative xanthine dehydrogenase subunit A [Frondihabitans sp. 762G35]
MLEIADRLLTALDAGVVLAVATAVSIDGSAPRTVGTSMAYDGDSVIGSIAGGCVEAAVVAVAEEVLADGQPQTVEYGVDDETAFGVGLTCGGQLRIRVERVSAGHPAIPALRLAASGRPAGVAVVVDGVVPDAQEPRVASELAARVALGETGLALIDCDGERVEVFFEVLAAKPHFVILGAMEFSTALAAAAAVLGYRVTVVDPRSLFATPERFPGAAVVVGWPQRILPALGLDARSVVAVLSHDARFDAEAIAVALASPACFVGAMGSRRTHDRRMASLRERGVPEPDLARLRSPIGLDLGASTPEETAIAILAEVVAARTGATGRPLTETRGAIHRRPAEGVAVTSVEA